MSAAPQLAPSDADPQETSEWLEALQAVIAHEGPERAHFLLEQLIALGHETGINMPYSANTEYINTIPADQRHLGVRDGLLGRQGWRDWRRLLGAWPHDGDGRLPASFEIVYGHAWKPEPRQIADGRAVLRFHPR